MARGLHTSTAPAHQRLDASTARVAALGDPTMAYLRIAFDGSDRRAHKKCKLWNQPRPVALSPYRIGIHGSFRATLRHHYCRYLPLIECRHSTSFTACD